MILAHPNYPNLPDFQVWVGAAMGIPQGVLTAITQQTYEECFNEAYSMVLWPEFASVPGPPGAISIWSLAVYNYGGALMVLYAPDEANQDPPTYWADLRQQYGLPTVAMGITTSASDQGTSTSLQVPEFVNKMLMDDLMLKQTPWGQRYLAYADSWGTVWGIS
jgi:hypothetical protein